MFLISTKEAGFTLVEVTLAILLTALLGGVILRLLQASELGFSTGWAVTEFDRETCRALEHMASDFRAARDTSHVTGKMLEVDQFDRFCRYEIVTSHRQHLIYRRINTGGGWTYQPKAPVARISIDPSDSSLVFAVSKIAPGEYQIQLSSSKQTARVRAYQRF